MLHKSHSKIVAACRPLVIFKQCRKQLQSYFSACCHVGRPEDQHSAGSSLAITASSQSYSTFCPHGQRPAEIQDVPGNYCSFHPRNRWSFGEESWQMVWAMLASSTTHEWSQKCFLSFSTPHNFTEHLDLASPTWVPTVLATLLHRVCNTASRHTLYL